MTEADDLDLEGLAPRELLQLGIDLFNAGRFFEAHEAWEEVWLAAPQPLRAFYQGLIQVAAAFVHLTRNEYPGTEKLLEEGVAKLEKYAPDFLGVDVETLVAEASVTRRRVIELGAKRLRQIDRASLPRVRQLPAGNSRFYPSAGSGRSDGAGAVSEDGSPGRGLAIGQAGSGRSEEDGAQLHYLAEC